LYTITRYADYSVNAASTVNHEAASGVWGNLIEYKIASVETVGTQPWTLNKQPVSALDNLVARNTIDYFDLAHSAG
jgi:hypothetical protein